MQYMILKISLVKLQPTPIEQLLVDNSFSLNEVSLIFTEIFLGISIILLLLFGILTSSNKKNNFPLIQNAMVYLTALVLFFSFFLLYNGVFFYSKPVIFNSTIIIDSLSLYFKLFILIISIISLIIILPYLKKQKINSFEYIILLIFSIFGTLLLCSSHDLITAYLAIEVQSLSFYLLATYKKTSVYSTEAGLKYFVLGAFSSSLFLFGSSLIYGLTGSTNFEDFRDLFFFTNSENIKSNLFFELKLIQLGLTFILISLFFKLALVPFHIWSPDVYEGSLTSSTFFFVLTPKIGLFILLIRIYLYCFYSLIENWQFFFVFIALLSIITGSFAGLEQKQIKSLLAYSSISHMGYLLLAFSTATFEGLQSVFFYLIIYILSGLCVWSILITLIKKNKEFYDKKGNKDLTDLSSLFKANKMLSLCFLITFLSIAGLPPLIGFYAKVNIFLSVIGITFYFAAIIGIISSVIATFYYLKIIKIIFFENVIAGKLFYPISYFNSFIISFCSFLLIYFFINPNFIYLICYKIALISNIY